MRTKIFVVVTVLAAGWATLWTAHLGAGSWVLFPVFLITLLLSSGLKVALAGGQAGMSLNFPFILLAVVQLSPLQAMLLAFVSVGAQSRFKVQSMLNLVQTVFNAASTMCATAAAAACYLALSRQHLALTPALALSAVVYFVVSTGTVALVITSGRDSRALHMWLKEFAWYLPFYFVGGVLAAMTDIFSGPLRWLSSLLLLPLVYTIYRAYSLQHTRLHERAEHLVETQALHHRTIEGLSMAIEAKDQNTHEHLFRVRRYVEEVGAGMKLAEPVMEALRTASFLHDIGKLAVPEHILNKPGKLSPAEFEKMKIHPVVGADILERVRFPYPVVPIVRSHHEWWDGSGYPDGLAGTAIPIGARVLSAVDCFDAMVSDRPYRKGVSIAEALAMVRSMSGIQFDPQVVTVMDALYANMGHCDAGQNSGFGPLRTDFAVWRGQAPGAGFEQSRGSTDDQALVPRNPDSAYTRLLREQDSLNRVAAARQQAQTLFDMSQAWRDLQQARVPQHQTHGPALSLTELLQVMTTRVRDLVPSDCCALYLRTADTVTLRFVDSIYARSFSAEPTSLGEGISGWVAQSGKPILNGNAGVERSYKSSAGSGPELHAALSVPLYDLHHEVFAVLTLYSVTADSFARDHLRMLEAMSSKLALTLLTVLNVPPGPNVLAARGARRPLEPGLLDDPFSNARSLPLAEGLPEPVPEEMPDPMLDPLTGLPSGRSLFLQLTRQLAVSGRGAGVSVSVVVCGLNGFTQVTEQRGQPAGNRLLSAVADALVQYCGAGNVVARMGGDEFVLLLSSSRSVQVTGQGAPLADCLSEIAAAVQAASRRAALGVAVSASLGAAYFPDDAVTAEGLLAVAERRMQLARQEARLQRQVIAIDEHRPAAAQGL